MATKQLIDQDGNLAKGAVGNTIIGDGTTAIPAEGYYVVKGIATSGSTLPTGIEAGYLVYLTETDVPAIDDDVAPITFTELCYVQNGSLDFNKDEIETTTLCDGIKTYRAGRTDLSGAFDGVYESGNEEVRELVNRFIDTVKLSADGSTADLEKQNSDIFYLQYQMNKDSTQNEPVEFFFMPITILSTSSGIAQGSAQTFSANIRVTNDTVNNIKPALYTREVV